MEELISKFQLAFLAGRWIQYGVLIVSEIANFATRNKDQCLVVKVDFSEGLRLCFVGLFEVYVQMYVFWI